MNASDYVKLGSALFKEHKYEEALLQYNKAIKLDPQHPNARFNCGLVLFNMKKYPDAIKQFQKSIEINPSDFDAHIGWGNTLMKLREYDDAIKQYKEACKINPQKGEAHLGWGNALAKLQKYDEAIELFNKAIQLDPKNADAHYNLGFVLSISEKYDEAIEQYKETLKINHDHIFANFSIGVALGKQEKYDEAIDQYKKSYRINPNNASVYHNIALTLWTQCKFNESSVAFEKARQTYEQNIQKEKNNHNADYFLNYGLLIHMYERDNDKTLEILHTGLAFNTNHTDLLTTIIKVYYDSQDEPQKQESCNTKYFLTHKIVRTYFRTAEKLLKTSLKKEKVLNLHNTNTLQKLGDLYLIMEEFDDAEIYLNDALKQKPESAEPYNSLGLMYSRKGNFRQAQKYFEGAHHRKYNDLNTWSNLAEIYFKTNPKDLRQIDKAEAEYKKILQICPEHIDSLIGIGEVFVAKAEFVEKDFYEIAVKRYNDAIILSKSGKGSKPMKTKEIAALHYSQGYARVMYFEASKPYASKTILEEALKNFKQCINLDPEHYKAEIAHTKLKNIINKFFPRFISDQVSSWLVVGLSIYIFIFAQIALLINGFSLFLPYCGLTCGSLIFIVVGLFLPNIQKLKGAGIELEKSPSTQITDSSTIFIKADTPPLRTTLRPV